MTRRQRVAMAALIGAAITVVLGASTASAHPLGNFSVNHAHALRFTADGIVDDAVVDTAEIPTAQAERTIDADGDGSTSPVELSSFGEKRCEALLAAVELTIDDEIVPFTLTDTSFERLPGDAGLTTSRLECRLEADVDLTQPRDVQFLERFELSRVGWREITAVGDGAQLVNSPVPTQSTSNGLRDYPVDLLNSPLDVRDASFQVAPGTAAGPSGEQSAPALSADPGRSLSEGGPLAGLVDEVTGVFDDLVGRRDLTLGVGLLAVALAIVLGASHAVLPGHGKTVMAAYIAGRQGTARDAIMVGATVTATHTGGVLILGLALTVSSSLAGETVLAWLGVASGLLIAFLGASLLVGSARHRPSALHHGHTHHGHHHHGPGAHTHGHDDHVHHDDEPGGHTHGHDDHVDHHHGPRGHTHSHDDHVHDHHGPGGHTHSHDDHVHDHHDHSPPSHVHLLHSNGRSTPDRAERRSSHADPVSRRTVVARRSNGEAVAVAERPRTAKNSALIVSKQISVAPASPAPRPVSRRALVGMGVAGGLVPSPSALVVLLSAIALGRTAFGVLLIIGYGLGMAATLTAAGLLLVRVRDRYERRAAGRAARGIGAAAARWQKIMPYVTAGLVLLVGIGLALRSLNQLN